MCLPAGPAFSPVCTLYSGVKPAIRSLLRAPTVTRNMILQRFRNTRMVLGTGELTDQGVRPVWQRQSRARAERYSWSCLDRTQNWPLPCRDSPEMKERQIPGHVWEQIPVVLFGNRFLVLFGKRTVLKWTFYNLGKGGGGSLKKEKKLKILWM